jgi:hypothetical protein
MDRKIIYGMVSVFLAGSFIAACGIDPLEQDPSESYQTSKSDLAVKNFLWENFERYKFGASIPDENIWVQNGSSYTEITKESPFKNKNLKIEITEDSSESDYIGVKFCINTLATDILTSSFYIKLNNLVNWTGLGVASDEDNMLYWWWIRADGTVFNGHTFDSFMEGVWQKVEISIDRISNTATFILDGNETVFNLDLNWSSTDPNQPMQCIFVFMGVFDTPQSVQIDNVVMLGF